MSERSERTMERRAPGDRTAARGEGRKSGQRGKGGA
jgi:hypothetical protein